MQKRHKNLVPGSMEVYQLGYLNDSVVHGYFNIVTKKIEEKPLLDFEDAFWLAFQAIVILILGGLVQVSIQIAKDYFLKQ